MSSTFQSGISVSESFFHEIIEPIIAEKYPKLKYGAALIGPGSEVLGFDTKISTDHDWRPRVFLFLPAGSYSKFGQNLEELIHASLPKQYLGYNLSVSSPDDLRSRYVYSIKTFTKQYLAFDANKKATTLDWLTFDEHRLLGTVSGKVFRDDNNEIEKMRTKLSYYPKDVWIYMMASEWAKIAEEEAFVGRTGHVNDEVGSRIIATRITQSLMRICFLIEKQYAPYSKWFGSSFKQLKCSKRFLPILDDVFNAKSWKKREKSLSLLYAKIVSMHNKLGITSKMNTKVHQYHERPYFVIGADQIATALQKTITNRQIKKIPLIGSVNQFTDSVRFIENDQLRLKSKDLYS